MVFPPGHPHHSPLYQDLQLEQRQHVLPYHHREPGPWQQATVRNLFGEKPQHPFQFHFKGKGRFTSQLVIITHNQPDRWWSCQGYKMDDLLTSYISQMLTTMTKQRTSRGKWGFQIQLDQVLCEQVQHWLTGGGSQAATGALWHCPASLFTSLVFYALALS